MAVSKRANQYRRLTVAFSASFDVNIPVDRIERDIKQYLDAGLSDMATDTMKLSQKFAPVDTGALRSSHRVQREEASDSITYLVSANTPYATRRHFENRKNPQTLRYLERAVEQTTNNPRRYFR